MPPHYDIVPYRPELRDQVIDLFQYLYGPDVVVNTLYFEWKYVRNPYIESPLIYLALYEGQVIGMRGMYGAQWNLGSSGHSLYGPLATDLIIHPDHRNQGVVTKIMRAALSNLSELGYTYIFNLSATPITRLGSLSMGWRSAGLLSSMRWTTHPAARARWQLHQYAVRFLPYFFSYKQNAFAAFDRNSTRRRKKVSPAVSVARTPRPESMADLTTRIGSTGYIQHVRDHAYFSWRFQNPLSRYRFVFWDGIGLEGYLVLRQPHRITQRTSSMMHIVDWAATTTTVLSELLQAAIQWGDFQALQLWSSPLPEEVRTGLHQIGFQSLAAPQNPLRSRRPHVLARPVSDTQLKADWSRADIQLLDIANWHIRMIDSDAF